jgi:hypothetical protein
MLWYKKLVRVEVCVLATASEGFEGLMAYGYKTGKCPVKGTRFI